MLNRLVGEGPAAVLQAVEGDGKGMLPDVGREAFLKIQRRNLGSREGIGGGRLLEFQHAGVGRRLLEHGQVAEIADAPDFEGFYELPQFVAVAGAHPFIGQNIAKMPAFAQQPNPEFHEIDIQIGRAGKGAVVVLQVRFVRREFFLADIRRIPHHHVKTREAAFLVEHFGEFEAPLESIFEDAVAFDFLDFRAEFLDFLLEFLFFLFALLFQVFFIFAVGGVRFEQKMAGEAVVEFRHQFVEAFALGVVLADFGAKIAFYLINQSNQAQFDLPVGGAVVIAHETLVGRNVVFEAFQRPAQVGVEGEAAHERIALFDIDINIRQRFQFAAFGVIRVFQQFDPEAKPADFHGIGVDVHPEQAIFDDALFFPKQRLLDALVFLQSPALPELIAEKPLFVRYDQFVVFHPGLHRQAHAALVGQNAQFRFDGNDFI